MANIVVVEDDQMLGEIYETTLVGGGHKVTLVNDGAGALPAIQEKNPDLVFLDLMIPSISGDEVLRQLRETDWGKDIKVIITTNISEAEAPEILRTLQFERYLIKANTGPSELLGIANQAISAT